VRKLSDDEVAVYLITNPCTCEGCGNKDDWSAEIRRMIDGSHQKQYRSKKSNPDMIVLSCNRCGRPPGPRGFGS
jgi:hypothetical protein